jgi:LDH2 family malate/lactate/ureidoglycolate dehydrogenase
MLNTSHLGRLGYFVEHAANRGFIGIAAAGGAQRYATQAPWGGVTPVFCTNPLAVGVPRREAEPIVYDIATTQIARGAILMARKRNEAIPEGWALDADGSPTTDPHQALPPQGTLAPLGGYKGSGLALVVEILSSVLGGYPPEESSSFFGAFKIDAFTERSDFFGGLEGLVDVMRASAPEDGSREVLLPGERSARRRSHNERDGVEMAPALWDEIAAVAAELGVRHALLTR